MQKLVYNPQIPQILERKSRYYRGVEKEISDAPGLKFVAFLAVKGM